MSEDNKVSRGLGDTVAKVIAITSLGSIKPKKGCGCDKRKDILNKAFPYKKTGEK